MFNFVSKGSPVMNHNVVTKLTTNVLGCKLIDQVIYRNDKIFSYDVLNQEDKSKFKKPVIPTFSFRKPVMLTFSFRNPVTDFIK